MKLVIEVDIPYLNLYTERERTIILHEVFSYLHDDYANGRDERQHDADLMCVLEMYPEFSMLSPQAMTSLVKDFRAIEQAIENQFLDEVNKRDA